MLRLFWPYSYASAFLFRAAAQLARPYIMHAFFSPDGARLASGSKDQTIKLRNVANGLLLQNLSSTTGQLNTLAFLNEHTLASVSREGYLSLWKV